MALGGGGRAGAVSEINVTPLIDVLLVLLIIFMVIIPVVPHGLSAIVPLPARTAADPEPPTTIVLSVLPGDPGKVTYKINEERLSRGEVEPKLASIFTTREDRVMFVKGDPRVDYGDVADAIDLGRQAGVANIGIITPKIEAGR